MNQKVREAIERLKADLAASLPAACIGPVTADTARQLGFDVRIEARAYTIPGLAPR
jgi:uroporphyrinogen-III synthase